MSLPSSPNNRREVYLSNIAGQGTTLPTEPHTREEEYLDYIARNGGGGGGTGEGDMKKAVYDDDLAVATAGGIADYVSGAIANKVDKVSGKGLSTNDYDNSAKAIVDGVTTALDGKVSKSNVAGLLKNDGTVDTTSYATAASVTAIKDGQSIDSFGDVESALSDKVSKSSTVGLLKNDGSVDTNTYAQSSALSGYIAKSATGGLVKNDGTIDTITAGAASANTSAISAIKDGTSIDSFGDVESALDNKVSWEANTKLGAKNLLPFATYKPFDFDIDIIDDLTVTIYRQDGTVNLNGTDGNSGGDYKDIVTFGLDKGEYILNGVPSGVNAKLTLMNLTDSTTIGSDTGSGLSFTLSAYKQLKLKVEAIQDVAYNNVDICPMIRLAEDTDSSFEPYSMSNQELTRYVKGWTAESQVSNGSISFSTIDDSDSNAYELFISVNDNSTEKNPTAQITSISGAGTSNMSITFSTNADSGAYGKLKIL